MFFSLDRCRSTSSNGIGLFSMVEVILPWNFQVNSTTRFLMQQENSSGRCWQSIRTRESQWNKFRSISGCKRRICLPSFDPETRLPARCVMKNHISKCNNTFVHIDATDSVFSDHHCIPHLKSEFVSPFLRGYNVLRSHSIQVLPPKICLSKPQNTYGGCQG